jgi:hypothetical protein
VDGGTGALTGYSGAGGTDTKRFRLELEGALTPGLGRSAGRSHVAREIMTDLDITTSDGGRFTGYLAKPAKKKAPGLLLIQEIFGVNKVMRGIADEFAKQGYLVLCPDLF